VVRNKGAVGVKFVVGSTSVLVVGCHLASGQNNVVNRNNDFRRIEKELFKDVSSQPASELCDVCIYLGDLNYRINGIRRDVENLLDLEILDPLRKGDQLLKELLQNTLFAGFQEGPLVFDPTYRYDIGTNVFDTSKKQRVPGWTDRVLYKSKGFKMVQKSYNSLPSSLTSDHRPVFAQFKLKYEDYVQSTNKSTNSRTCQVF
jgi:inositol-1,4,5-trisphosphate 5-phosphatase